MPIDTSAAKSEWQSGAKAKVDKLIRKYTARTDKVARATSDAAQKAYVEGVTDPTSQKLRLIRLKELTDSDLNAAMEAKGRVSYPAGVDAAVEKYGRRVDPYFKELDAIVPRLKPAVRDARTNVMERVLPIAVGLQNKKKAIIGK
jgi:hypothetical protein